MGGDDHAEPLTASPALPPLDAEAEEIAPFAEMRDGGLGLRHLSCTRLVPRAFEDLLDIGRDPWRGFDRLAVDLDGDVA